MRRVQVYGSPGERGAWGCTEGPGPQWVLNGLITSVGLSPSRCASLSVQVRCQWRLRCFWYLMNY